ncbi:bifunctional molybdenum cofactor biosynthesis protein MoaC/MoaB [Algoriphagus sp. H41]|uniref:Bifunctional molybdenum cofactor biosynthesis protein MoaC/MoaB n=1 Tax=Algoriphagus oliviformis TaxID=2811231 RepID=A0ABS3C8Y5_9BACT|nr:bifunctional molybdenum cofactor biosynthesis protein MoaC/MoaB [Algoriphagus oliviformis]MBN7813029.1 bifunctional molybdenum cofactor biosynthesis protein MoaC/MoaB [Algoriphagus oliviformis]
MEDITPKSTTLQEAQAEAVLKVSKSETVAAILEKRVPKGDVLEMAKVAGLFAVKNTHLQLPQAYPTPIEFTSVEYQVEDLEIRITVRVRSVSKSSLEMHALHGVSITALTMYDMLKPLDKGISIARIGILEKEERKLSSGATQPFNAAVVLCSNAVLKGIKPDSAGQAILEKLRGYQAKITSYELLPDDLELIRAKAKSLALENRLVIFAGGTGLAKTDVTTEALEPLLDRKIPGIAEAMRSYGQCRTPHAMLSRSLAGMVGNCLVLAIPGSSRGAAESMEALFPQLLEGAGI